MKWKSSLNKEKEHLPPEKEKESSRNKESTLHRTTDNEYSSCKTRDSYHICVLGDNGNKLDENWIDLQIEAGLAFKGANQGTPSEVRVRLAL